MSLIEILAVIAIVVFVIGRQLVGEPLRGRRLILLPAVLAVVGFADLRGHGSHPTATDVGCIAVSAVIAAAVGAGQGAVTRLESRDGALWGRMPAYGLWLWLALIASRFVMMLIAHGLGAEVAGSFAPLLFLLGVNRLAQAAVVTRRALSSGIPFAPEKDGRVFLGDRLQRFSDSSRHGDGTRR